MRRGVVNWHLPVVAAPSHGPHDPCDHPDFNNNLFNGDFFNEFQAAINMKNWSVPKRGGG